MSRGMSKAIARSPVAPRSRRCGLSDHIQDSTDIHVSTAIPDERPRPYARIPRSLCVTQRLRICDLEDPSWRYVASGNRSMSGRRQGWHEGVAARHFEPEDDCRYSVTSAARPQNRLHQLITWYHRDPSCACVENASSSSTSMRRPVGLALVERRPGARRADPDLIRLLDLYNLAYRSVVRHNGYAHQPRLCCHFRSAHPISRQTRCCSKTSIPSPLNSNPILERQSTYVAKLRLSPAPRPDPNCRVQHCLQPRKPPEAIRM